MFPLLKRKTQDSKSQSVFEDLIRRHEAGIYRFAYRLTGNHEDAEDLIQEAILEAYSSFHRFKPGTYFDRWLFRILRNNHIDGKRVHPKVTIQSLDTPQEGLEGPQAPREIIDWSNQPEIQMLAATLDEPIQQALLELPEEFRLVVVLADMEGLTYEEVSRIAGCPVGTVRSRLHRGRLMLKDKLQNYL